MTGNWVSSVSPRSNKKAATGSGMNAAKKAAPKAEPAPDNFDDEIPF